MNFGIHFLYLTKSILCASRAPGMKSRGSTLIRTLDEIPPKLAWKQFHLKALFSEARLW